MVSHFHPDAAGITVSSDFSVSSGHRQDEKGSAVPLRVGVLGPVTVWRDGHEVMAGQPRQLAVLGVLATRANRVVSRGELVDAVWGRPAAGQRRQRHLHLRGGTAPRARTGQAAPGPGQVAAGPRPGACLLGRRLPAAARPRRPRRRPVRGRPRPVARAARGRRPERRGAGRGRGARLWRGQPFAGVPGPFAEAERLRLTELRTTAAEERADLMLAQGQPAAAVPELTALVGRAPAARAGAGAADDRPVPVRQAGRGAARLP